MSKLKHRYDCPLVLSHELLGGKWKGRILWNIIQGNNRFSVLKRELPDISEKVLYTILRDLEDAGLVTREVVEHKSPKIILYHIHQNYKNLKELISMMCDFSLEYAGKNEIQINSY